MVAFRKVATAIGLMVALGLPNLSMAQDRRAEDAFQTWYALILELVRHTPTQTPPVASRAFAYTGITAYEAVASGRDDLQTFAGQLNALTPLPDRDPSAVYDDAVLVQAAMAHSVRYFFSNTGPSGQRAMEVMAGRLSADVAEGVPADVAERSIAFGQAIADHIIAWSLDDGGAVVVNMGFPLEYPRSDSPAEWVPTGPIQQQQAPLLPDWGNNRTFATPDGGACPLPPPPEYSEDPVSQFYIEAKEVYDASEILTDDQTAIARFWSDDPMLSSTPPGHWIAIAINILRDQDATIDRQAQVMALLGIGVADAFISNWRIKYQYNLVRPITYIRRVMDPAWNPILITPPFPEYPSGHSTQSGTAADILADLFGQDFAFEDSAHTDEGLPTRHFDSFWDAAENAGISRLYGGIHFRSAIELGLEQGRCIAVFTNALITRE